MNDPTIKFQPEDPRRLAREALSRGRSATLDAERDGAFAEAHVWATLANADATHRLAKVLAKQSNVPDSIRDERYLKLAEKRTLADDTIDFLKPKGDDAA